MTFTNTFIALIIASRCCFCQEKIRVNVDNVAVKTEPTPTTGKMMSADNLHPHSIWRIDLFAYKNESGHSETLETRIVNMSVAEQVLPISQDGLKVIAKCPNHTVLEDDVSVHSRSNTNYYHSVGSFYGCEALPATLVKLAPGEWVAYTISVQAKQLPEEILASTHIGHKRYDGHMVEDLEFGIFEESLDVAVKAQP